MVWNWIRRCSETWVQTGRDRRYTVVLRADQHAGGFSDHDDIEEAVPGGRAAPGRSRSGAPPQYPGQ